MKYADIVMNKQAGQCLLCSNPVCTSACPKGLQADRIIRALRFENVLGAAALLPKENPCRTCEGKHCMESCVKNRIDTPVAIPDLVNNLYEKNINEDSNINIDLSTEVCGVKCENPFLLSSSVVGSNYEMVAKAFEMGWAGVAFKTIGLFVPDEVSPRFDHLQKEGNPFVGFKNIEQISDHTLEDNLAFFRELKKNYPTKILIVSIMGQNEAEWTKLAQISEEAGADIIECNFSCPHMTAEGLGSDVGSNPELVAKYTKATRKGTKLPILAKMTPNITAMQVPAAAAIEAGADGIAAINTIKSIMNINLDNFVSGPEVEGRSAVGGYSGKAVKPIALRFIHDMKSDQRLKSVPISGMGGIETWKDATEFIAMGCSTVQITTSVMQYGYRIIDDLRDGLMRFMRKNQIDKVETMLGKAMEHIVPADDLNRHSICYPKFDRSKCVSCGRCYISCYDGGHQALKQNEKGQPVMIADKCVGCHLCLTVCPAQAITAGVRVEKERIK